MTFTMIGVEVYQDSVLLFHSVRTCVPCRADLIDVKDVRCVSQMK